MEAALKRGDLTASAEEIRSILARSTARISLPLSSAAAPVSRRGHSTAARQALALIEHGLSQLQAAPELVPVRLAQFLREALTSYAYTYDQAGQPEELTPPDKVADRMLARLENRQVAARPARVGLLTAREVAAIAAGQLTPAQAPTVRASGRISQDIQAWYANTAVPQERKEILQNGKFEDGEYLLAFIQPTMEGQTIEIHALTSAGRPTPAPVARFEVATELEPVSAAEVLVAPAITGQVPEQRDRLLGLIPEEPEEDRTSIGHLREAAIEINQARIDLYAEILRQRTDLRGAARLAAERRLQRMEQESEGLASGAPEPRAVERSLASWAQEISRDLVHFAARSKPQEQPEAQSAALDALARMGAVKTRLEDTLAAVRGVAPSQGNYPRLSEQARVLVSPQLEASSIFDTIGQAPIASTAQRAGRETVGGESLATSIMLKDAERTAPPARETRDLVRALATAGKRLQQALTDIGTLGESGLQLSSTLRPLLRTEGMPSDVRPSTHSPLLRNLLLPAMERVSGPGKALARMPSLTGASLTPEALYGVVLGEAGKELAERKPQVARNLLEQMGGLSQRLQQAGGVPSVAAIAQAGQEMREQVASLATQAEAPDASTAEEAATEAVGETIGAGLDKGMAVIDSAGGAAGSAVDQVAEALEQEGSALSSEIKSRIEPFVNISAEARVFSGPVATAALSEMGAEGATVGSDIFVRQDIVRAGPQVAAPVIGHEMVHAQKLFRSVESEEQEAYGVEAAIRRGISRATTGPLYRLQEELKELASDQPYAADLDVPGVSKPGAEASKESKSENLIDALTDKVAELWAREVDTAKQRSGSA